MLRKICGKLFGRAPILSKGDVYSFCPEIRGSLHGPVGKCRAAVRGILDEDTVLVYIYSTDNLDFGEFKYVNMKTMLTVWTVRMVDEEMTWPLGC